MRNVARLLAVLILLLSGALGLVNGLSDLPDAVTPRQLAVTGCVLAYAVLGTAAAIGITMRRRWGFWLAVLWTLPAVGAAAGGVLVYADPSTPRSAAIAAGAAAALIGILTAWAARIGTRPRPPRQPVAATTTAAAPADEPQ